MTLLNIPEIETERLVLRQPAPSHLSDWATRVFADPDVIRYMPKRDMTTYARRTRTQQLHAALDATQSRRVGDYRQS